MKNVGLLSLVLLQSVFPTAQPINEQFLLDMGGNDIYLEIAGRSRNAPLLVFLYSGAGNAATSTPPLRANVGNAGGAAALDAESISRLGPVLGTFVASGHQRPPYRERAHAGKFLA